MSETPDRYHKEEFIDSITRHLSGEEARADEPERLLGAKSAEGVLGQDTTESLETIERYVVAEHILEDVCIGKDAEEKEKPDYIKSGLSVAEGAWFFLMTGKVWTKEDVANYNKKAEGEYIELVELYTPELLQQSGENNGQYKKRLALTLIKGNKYQQQAAFVQLIEQRDFDKMTKARTELGELRWSELVNYKDLYGVLKKLRRDLLPSDGAMAAGANLKMAELERDATAREALEGMSADELLSTHKTMFSVFFKKNKSDGKPAYKNKAEYLAHTELIARKAYLLSAIPYSTFQTILDSTTLEGQLMPETKAYIHHLQWMRGRGKKPTKNKQLVHA